MRYHGLVIQQQDYAPPHTGHNTVNVINEHIRRAGWDINQSPQSPDLLDYSIYDQTKLNFNILSDISRNWTRAN